jgi:phosphate transport system substrate-binding protein
MSMRRVAVLLVGLTLATGAWAQTEMVGAGSTFVQPLYGKIFDVYAKDTGVRVNYQGIGSGGGIQQLYSRVVDFGATDVFLSNQEMASAPAPILNIPIVAGAVTLSYNLPGNPELRFTPDLIARLFLGQIRNWDDPALAAANPGVKLPNLAITIVHRSDGSGTTDNFTNYLSKVSAEWKSRVGEGLSVNWPVGIGGKGNPGVAGLIKQLPGALGYVELIYALQNSMPTGLVRNRSGAFIKPTLASTQAAANIELPGDMRIMLTDTAAPDGYPIVGFTYILVYKEQDYGNRSRAKADALAKLLWWMTHDGQKYAEPLSYSPLGPAAVQRTDQIIRAITWNGVPILR